MGKSPITYGRSALLAVFLAGSGQVSAQPQASGQPDLESQLETYFKESDPVRRKEIAQKTAQRWTYREVLDSLREVQLWSDVPPSGEFSIAFREEALTFRYQTSQYDRQRENHLLLILPGARWHGTFLSNIFLDSMQALYARNGEDPLDAERVNLVLRELRKRFHLSNVSVFSSAQSAGSAWAMILWHSHEFSNSSIAARLPTLPYPRQLWPPLAENLTGTTWPPCDPAKEATFENAVCELLRVKLTEANGETWRGFLVTDPVTRYFRNVHQSDAVWLRAIEMRDGPWTAEQISIVPPAGADADEFITEVLKSKLGYLHGRIDGETIDIQSRNCERIELRILEGMVDLEKPVTIMVNGRKRSEAVIRPSVETMLETAYEEWRFTRPVLARIAFGVHKDTEE